MSLDNETRKYEKKVRQAKTLYEKYKNGEVLNEDQLNKILNYGDKIINLDEINKYQKNISLQSIRIQKLQKTIKEKNKTIKEKNNTINKLNSELEELEDERKYEYIKSEKYEFKQ